MLVLSRKKDESIRIGDVTVIVVRIHGNTVRIGIDAPKETPILRGELERKTTDEPTTPQADQAEA